jgi:hypothetical protein
VIAPNLSSSESSVQFCFFKPKETEEELNGSYVLFATDCAQAAHEAKNHQFYLKRRSS